MLCLDAGNRYLTVPLFDLYGRVPPLSKQPPKTALCAVPAITLKLFVVIRTGRLYLVFEITFSENPVLFIGCSVSIVGLFIALIVVGCIINSTMNDLKDSPPVLRQVILLQI